MKMTSLGMGGSVWGPELESSCAENHWRQLVVIKDRYFAEDSRVAENSVFLHLSWAGSGSPDLQTDIGEIETDLKRRGIEIAVHIGLKDFNHSDELKFRNFFVAHLTEALNRVANHKNCIKIGVDPNLLRQTWQTVCDEYLALGLPLPLFIPSAELEEIPPTPAEYFFNFEDKAGLRKFQKAVRAIGFTVEWDDDSDSFYCVVVDPASVHHTPELEAQLSEIASASGGAYDGWAAV